MGLIKKKVKISNLEDLDFVIDMSKEDLVVNPESPYLPLAYMY